MREILKIGVGADHGGYELKEEILLYLSSKDYLVEDFGCFSRESVDYPLFAIKVGNAIKNDEISFGILICTTGIGMSISANKISKVRAALVNSVDAAFLTRLHNDSNVLCLGAKYTSNKLAFEIIDMFLKTKFEGGRHTTRVNIIKDLDI